MEFFELGFDFIVFDCRKCHRKLIAKDLFAKLFLSAAHKVVFFESVEEKKSVTPRPFYQRRSWASCSGTWAVSTGASGPSEGRGDFYVSANRYCGR